MLDQTEEMSKILDRHKIPHEFIISEGDHSYSSWATHRDAYFRLMAQEYFDIIIQISLRIAEDQ